MSVGIIDTFATEPLIVAVRIQKVVGIVDAVASLAENTAAITTLRAELDAMKKRMAKAK